MLYDHNWECAHCLHMNFDCDTCEKCKREKEIKYWPRFWSAMSDETDMRRFEPAGHRMGKSGRKKLVDEGIFYDKKGKKYLFR